MKFNSGILDNLLTSGKALVSDVGKKTKDSILANTVEAVRKTNTGKKFEAEATKQKITQLLPIIIIGIILIFFISKRVKL